jgi:hypothetical protein
MILIWDVLILNVKVYKLSKTETLNGFERYIKFIANFEFY